MVYKRKILSNLFVRLYATDLVNETYVGLLARNADSVGLDAYSRTLSRSADLSALIAELAASDEFTEKHWAGISSNVIRSAIQGLLDRDPQPEDIVRFSIKLTGTHDVAKILSEIGKSEERWRKSFGERAGYLVGLAFQGLLGRAPDQEVQLAYASRLAETHDFALLLAEIVHSDECWNRSLDARSMELVKSVFTSLLDHEPGPEALQRYAATLSETHELGQLVDAITRSNEYWERSLSARSVDLVGMLYEGLLFRKPEPEALKDYSKRLTATPNLAPLLTEIASSEEHWGLLLQRKSTEIVKSVCEGLEYIEPSADVIVRHAEHLEKHKNLSLLISAISGSADYMRHQLKLQAPKLVEAIYQGLLNRKADHLGLKSYSEQISELSQVGVVIAKICNSPEYVKKINDSRPTKKTEASSLIATIEHIERLYGRYRNRSASTDELVSHINNQDTIGQILGQLLDNKVKTDKPTRVLLYGAFGNGNMGDSYQAMAVRAHIIEHLSISSEEIYACSLLNSAPYPFPSAQILPSNAILSPELVNSFDYLIIGGGGLLAHPHAPLFDNNWVQRIDIPIVLLSVGAVLSKIVDHQKLLDNSLMVSGRDLESVKSLRTRRPDSELISDPILSIQSVRRLMEFDLPSSISPSNTDVLWILKHPSSDSDKQVLHWIANYIASDLERKHVIVAIEPKLDKPLDNYFPHLNICYFYSLSELSIYIEKSKFVFSMRYHGVIFSAMLGKPAFGFSQNKIKALFTENKLIGEYLENVNDFDRVLGSLQDFKKRLSHPISPEHQFKQLFDLIGIAAQ